MVLSSLALAKNASRPTASGSSWKRRLSKATMLSPAAASAWYPATAQMIRAVPSLDRRTSAHIPPRRRRSGDTWCRDSPLQPQEGAPMADEQSPESKGQTGYPPPQDNDPNCDPQLIDEVACKGSGVAAQASYNATYQDLLKQA